MKSLRRNKEIKVLDPEAPFLPKWNKIVLVCCVVAVCLDPLLFFIPLVDADKLCLSLDKKLSITFCVLRSFIDLFYVFHIFFKFRTGFIDPSSRVYGSGQLVIDPRAIMKKYLQSYFIIDILSILPLPQVATVIIPAVRSWVKIYPLTIIITAQNIVRFLRILPLLKEVTKTSGLLLTETAWGGATLNFGLYILASHIIGSFWYLASVERADRCWRNACSGDNSCNFDDLYCGGDHHRNNSFLIDSCSPLEPTKSTFDYGIFGDALSLQLYTDSFRRFFYCFVWGLRNLSSLGQNLETSNNNIGENLFVVLISVNGLILFSILAGNIQRGLQSLTVRLDEMVVKKREQEQWMSRSMLPPDLRERVRRHEQYKWRKNRGVDEESLIRNLPKDLRRDIKRHKCWSLLIRVPMFEKMDEMLLDALCCRLKPVLYTADSIIVRDGDPVDEMLFIIKGRILTTTTNGGRNGFFNSVGLKAGDFYGEELLTWALDHNSSSSLPISTRTLRVFTNVEAFCLMPDDLKNVLSQFRRLHSKQLKHTFRFYSQQWRTWGACFIQAAWRRYYWRKIERLLREAEERMQGALDEGGHATSISAAIYSSRFASNMIGNLICGRGNNNMSSPKLATLLPQKPSEPNFNVEDRS